MLDGEGGYTVWGKLMPAAQPARGALPIGWRIGYALRRDVRRQCRAWTRVEAQWPQRGGEARRDMERRFGATRPAVAAQ